MKKHVMTARRRAALRKAQLASARKRARGRVSRVASRTAKKYPRTIKTAKIAVISAAFGANYYYRFHSPVKLNPAGHPKINPHYKPPPKLFKRKKRR